MDSAIPFGHTKMSAEDCFEPDFWTLTGSYPVIQAMPLPRRLESRRWRMKPRQPTLLGVPARERPTSLWRMVASMEAELMAAGRRSS